MPVREKPNHRLVPTSSGRLLRQTPRPGISKPFKGHRRRLAWAARPVSTMKARDRQSQAWSAPATAPNSGGADDYSLHDVRQDLERAHLESLPGARIIIARPRSVRHLDAEHASLQPAEFISQSSDGGSILGVLQRLEDVCFNFHVPFLCMPSHPWSEVDELRGVLSYNPASEACEFFCNSHDVALVGDSSIQSYLVRQGEIQIIEPGMWTIVVPSIPTPGGNGFARLCPVVKFLLLKRTYASTVTHTAATEGDGTTESSTTHTSVVDMSSSTSSSAQTVAEFVMGTVESSKSDKKLPSIPEEETLTLDPGPFYQLRDGETLQVTTKPAGGDDAEIEQRYAKTAESYRVTRLRKIDRNARSSVFACIHSKLPHTTLVAKALNVRPSIRNSISSLANHWANEMEILRNLNHRNIVKILGWDARFYTVYLEHLPDSLASYSKQSGFTNDDAQRILVDVASALAHLQEQGISHNDIKPRNIAYSPERGAVVLDFGLATRGAWVPDNAGGTAWYVPPEVLQAGPRSPRGNVWALGVTMLYVLGKIRAPEDYGSAWNFLNVQDPNGADRIAMESWVDEICTVVDELDLDDPVQYVMACMMEQEPCSRLAAHEIEPLLRKHLAAD